MFKTLEVYAEIKFSPLAIDPKYTLGISSNFVNFLSITPKTYRITDLSSLLLTISLNLLQLSSPLVAVLFKIQYF